jgi:hypothetical protein
MRGPFANSLFRNRKKLAIFSGLKFIEYKISTGLMAYASIVDPAFLWIGGVGASDLSGYADTDKKVVLTDTMGKQCTAYCGPVCGGETTGTDLFSGWDFTSGWSASTGASIIDADSYQNTTGFDYIYRDISGHIGKLIKVTWAGTVSGALGTAAMLNALSSAYAINAAQGYRNIKAIQFRLRNNEGTTTVCDTTTLEALIVTDGPVTGIKLLASPGGAIGVESTDPGFAPGQITEVRING